MSLNYGSGPTCNSCPVHLMGPLAIFTQFYLVGPCGLSWVYQSNCALVLSTTMTNICYIMWWGKSLLWLERGHTVLVQALSSDGRVWGGLPQAIPGPLGGIGVVSPHVILLSCLLHQWLVPVFLSEVLISPGLPCCLMVVFLMEWGWFHILGESNLGLVWLSHFPDCCELQRLLLAIVSSLQGLLMWPIRGIVQPIDSFVLIFHQFKGGTQKTGFVVFLVFGTMLFQNEM